MTSSVHQPGHRLLAVIVGLTVLVVGAVAKLRQPVDPGTAPGSGPAVVASAPTANGPADAKDAEPATPSEALGQAPTPPAAIETPTAAVAPIAPEPSTPAAPVVAADAADMARFLDRLMLAESGGRDTAKNPRSSALGAFQFIDSTFLEVVRRHFARETAGLNAAQILALRTDRAFARRAAEAFTRDNADQLAAHGLATSFANLRLAFFLGPAGAIRVLKAEPANPVIGIVGAGVVQANPFMAGMTAGDLATWAGRNLTAYSGARIASRDAGEGVPLAGTAITGPDAAAPPVKSPPKPAVAVKCNLALASCRKWLTLTEQQIAKGRQPPRGTQVRIGAKRPGTATR